jgi:hypothetical protein
MADVELDPFKDILGVAFDERRLGENIAAFAPILDEIRKLRSLDLTEVHPVVVFDPAQGYDR